MWIAAVGTFVPAGFTARLIQVKKILRYEPSSYSAYTYYVAMKRRDRNTLSVQRLVTGWTARDSNPGRGQEIFSSPKSPDRLQDTYSIGAVGLSLGKVAGTQSQPFTSI